MSMMGDEPAEETNKGPAGGSYRNAANRFETSGETEEDEATSVTGAYMAAMPVQDRRTSIPTSSRQATPGEMGGGNG